MSSVDKMSISGIRSFGPRDQDTQVIQFFSPVTLIVGPNGSGKTTIIECLKYATTGDLPPFSKGGAFVFDPKLLDEVETKGKIKLFIKDIKTNYLQVQKNLCVTQKAKKIEFRTLETVISRYNKDLNLASTVTSKCINADYEIINALGVSKAVLDNVIFCHQEDSNWPLSDGKTLKTKFDEIFSATKYIKTLDQLRKVRLEKQSQIKQQETDRKHLEMYKQKADELKTKLEDTQSKHDIFETKMSAIKQKLEPIESKLNELNEKYLLIYDLQRKYDSIDSEKSLVEKQINELNATVSKCLFTGDDDELNDYIENFLLSFNDMSKNIKSKESDLISLNNEYKACLGDKSKLAMTIGGLENEEKFYLKGVDAWKSKCEQLFKGINSAFSPVKSANIDDYYVKRMNDAFNKYKNDYDLETKEIDSNELKKLSEIERKIESNRDQKSKIDQLMTNKMELIEKNKSDVNRINGELKQFDSNLKQLDNIDTKVKKSENDLDDLVKSNDFNKLEKEIKQLNDDKSSLNKNLQSINQKIDDIHELTALKTTIDMYSKDKKVKIDGINKIKQRYFDDFLTFFNNDSDRYESIENSKLKSVFDSEIKQLQQSIDQLQTKNKDINKQLVMAESKRKLSNEDLRNKESQLRDCEDKLHEFDDISKFDTQFKEVQEQLRQYSDDKGFLNGVDKTYMRFIKQLNQNAASCPVCLRCFKDKSEIDDTINELRSYTEKIPQKINDLDTKLKDTNDIYENMLKLKPIKELYEQLKDEEIPKLKKLIESIDSNELKDIKTKIKSNEDELKKCSQRKSVADQLYSNVIIVDKYANEISELDAKLNAITGGNADSLSGSIGGEENIESLKEEKTRLNNEIEDINKVIEKKTGYVATNKEKIQKLREMLTELRNEKYQLSVKIQSVKNNKEKLNELIKINETESEEIDKLKEKIEPLLKVIRDLDSEKKSVNKTREELLDKRKSEMNNKLKLKQDIDDLHKQISNYELVGKKKLSETREKISDLNGKEKRLVESQDKLKRDLETIKSDYNRFEIKKRELDDNKRLREKKSELKKLNDELEGLNEQMKGINIKNIKQEQQKYEIERDKYRRDYDQARLTKTSLRSAIDTLNIELDTEQYKNADEKYKLCASDLFVLEMSVQDIDKYSKALDRAIMNYHNMKMDEINKTIKQLWKQVYRGTDIDSIEIRSDEDSTATGNKNDFEAACSSTSRRRTYNYRVVLIKGDTVLDMRGRCSCGQKVLASIIIRLALADTFCLNCGILALDEPTTNLDRDNIESLASALVDIIKVRSSQKNFQLIIITHDEDFVEMLGRSEYMDEFYRVFKDDRGFSRIARKNATSF